MFEKGQINLGAIISTALGVTLAITVVHFLGKKMTPAPTAPTAPATTTPVTE